MGTPTTGEVVLVPFPFSDLSQSKVRPAVCLADAGRGDWVLCQITSRPYGDPAAVPLDAPERLSGNIFPRKQVVPISGISRRLAKSRVNHSRYADLTDANRWNFREFFPDSL